MSESLSLPAKWYTEWQSPETFFKEVDSFLEIADSEATFTDPAYQAWLDAYIAGKFSVIRNTVQPIRVRMVRDPHPDFELEIEGRIVPFEATEADRVGRRRGDEYRLAAERRRKGLPPDLEGFDPGEELEAAREAIPRVLRRKAEKLYSPPPNLVVIVNLTTFGETLPLDELTDQTEPYRRSFESIWLVWGLRAIQTWPEQIQLVGPPIEFE